MRTFSFFLMCTSSNLYCVIGQSTCISKPCLSPTVQINEINKNILSFLCLYMFVGIFLVEFCLSEWDRCG